MTPKEPPANVLLGADDQALLTDFGIAALMDRNATGQHYLTVAYSAPEQRWQGQVLPASDVWSLGATLFVALTGEDPPQPTREHQESGQQDVAGSAVRAMQRLNAPADLVAVVHRCMQTDLMGRPDARTVHQTLLRPLAPPPSFPAPPPLATLPPPVTVASASSAPRSVAAATPHPTTAMPEVLAPTSMFTAAPAESHPEADGPHSATPPSPDAPAPVSPSPPRSPQPRRPNRKALSAIAFLAALVTIVAVVVLWVDRNSERDVAGTSATTGTGSGGSPAAVASLAASEARLAGPGDQCLIEGITTEEDEIIAVGYRSAPNALPSCCAASITNSCTVGGRRHLIYRYSDPAGWQVIELPNGGDGVGSQELHGIIDTGSALVAIGASWLSNPDDFAAVAWRSSDGESWQKAYVYEPTENDGPRQAFIDGVSNSSMILAVGHSGVDPNDRRRSQRLVATATTAGENWKPQLLALPTDVVSERMQGVAWTGEAFVAGGIQTVANGNSGMALWRSGPSGTGWIQVHQTTPTEFQEVSAIAAIGATVVAVGPRKTTHSDGVILRSADSGVSWSEVAVPGLSGPGDQTLYNLTVLDGWFVAIGTVDGADTCRKGNPCTVPLVLASRDGLNWQRLEVGVGATGPGHHAGTTVVGRGDGRWYALGHEGADDHDSHWWTLSAPQG